MTDKTTSEGARRIAVERQRQIEVEDWTPEHDDEHDDGSLARAAICYAAPELLYVRRDFNHVISFRDPWPGGWARRYDKRMGYGSRRADPHNGDEIPDPATYTGEERLDLLAKAGALIAAEIDRLLRAEERPDA